MDNKLLKDLENMNKVMDSAIGAMEKSSSYIKEMITPELLEKMTPTQIELINKSKSILEMKLTDPAELFKKQQEIVDLMELSKEETEKKV
jgi:hypothetical protein